MSQLLYGMYRRLVPASLKARLSGRIKQQTLAAMFRLTGNAAWAERLAAYCLRAGDFDGARAAHAMTFDAADRKGQTAISRRRQPSQFNFERALFQESGESVYDPLFHCSVLEGPLEVAGQFKVSFVFLGLKVSGQVKMPVDLGEADRPEQVRILLDGQLIRTIKLDYQENKARFSLTIKRPALEMFPPHADIAVESDNGMPLLFRGQARVARVQIPHARGGLSELLSDGKMLDKKGYLPADPGTVSARQDAYLDLYARARDAFDEEVGRPLFLLYGTLLGRYRDGDFIPGDDDFDVGFVSDKQNPDSVREETKAIMMKLVRAGFVISLNRRGKPFRIMHPEVGEDIHLDARPVWYQDGKVWAQRQAALELDFQGFKKVKTVDFRHVQAYIPKKTKSFLKAYYGPGWKYPDPAYSNASQVIPEWVFENLDRTCLGSGEIVRMQDRIEDERDKQPEMGTLIAIAMEDLYPLEEFERRVGW